MPAPRSSRSVQAAQAAVIAHFAARIQESPDALGRGSAISGNRAKILEIRTLMDHFTTLAQEAQRRGLPEATESLQNAAARCRALVRLDQCRDED